MKKWCFFIAILLLGCTKSVAAPQIEQAAKVNGKIAFLSDRFGGQFGILILKNGNVSELKTNLKAPPRWSPDGKKIAVASYYNRIPEIVIIDENGGVVRYGLEVVPFFVEWIGGSDKLIFSSVRNPAHGTLTGNLYVLNLANKKVSQLTYFDDQKGIEHLAVSATSSEIIFYRRPTGSSDEVWRSTEYLIANYNGQTITNVRKCPVYPSDGRWSPDGKRIVYGSGYYKGERVLKGYLLMYDFETGVETLVSENKQHFVDPTFSPDGKQILVSGWSGLYTMNLDGTNIQQIVPPKSFDTFNSHDTRPDWTA